MIQTFPAFEWQDSVHDLYKAILSLFLVTKIWLNFTTKLWIKNDLSDNYDSIQTLNDNNLEVTFIHSKLSLWTKKYPKKLGFIPFFEWNQLSKVEQTLAITYSHIDTGQGYCKTKLFFRNPFI